MFKEKEIRKHLIFSGRVQGVGFRYRAMNIAQMLGLTGWVKNRWDGKVEMEVQGKREEIGKMISMLYQQRFIWIEDIEEKEIPVEKESSFSIH
ncbi:acylphosphatase [Blautia sp. An46]|uniref:acylphosphatase n=1 Tax=Blautia sp. An46 TaxID=1965636 RepID=UPI000B385D6D|nr:acylphosphatase [Blautia sp. An46]OUN92816.1 acylphosphatase [Blautia sp. An46]HJD36692.1 acylphosphatase [Candidatus Blautia ornithocaccae]